MGMMAFLNLTKAFLAGARPKTDRQATRLLARSATWVQALV
jgi:hypothetical protein